MFIYKIFITGPIDNNTIVIACSKTKKAAVIDPGVDSSERVLVFCKKNNFKIEKILLTHSHWDHIAECAAIQKETHACVYVHKLDQANVKKPGSDNLPLHFDIPSIDNVVLIKDHEKICCGEYEVEVIHTPGHTPGSVCFYVKQKKVLFSGDTLFQGTMGRVDFSGGNSKEMASSLKKLTLLPYDTKVVPGHGNITTIGTESHWMKDAKKLLN